MKLFAISLNQHNIPLYLFTATASTLSSIVRLTHRNREQRLALQRTLDRKRLKQIALYLQQESSLIANNIILNFDDRVTFRKQPVDGVKNAGFIEIPDDEPCATILDGQHRLMGFQFCDHLDFELAVIGFLNLDQRQAADIFTVINTTQKPLQKSLLLDIRHYIGKTEGEERRATSIALALNKLAESPLKNRVRVAKGETGVITLDALSRLIVPFVDLGGVLERTPGKLEVLFRDYLIAFDDIFAVPINAGTIQTALSPVFERVIRRAHTLGFDNPGPDELRQAMAPVSDFDWKPDSLRNRKGRTGRIREFLARLPEGNQQEIQEWLL